MWNEWNNLSISNVITAILVIGLVGMALDQMLARGRATGDLPGMMPPTMTEKFICY